MSNGTMVKHVGSALQAPALAQAPAGFGGMTVMEIGQVLAKSQMFTDIKDASQACVKILRGMELGIGPIQSIENIHVVKGKTTLGAPLIGALIKRSGKYDYRIDDHTAARCQITFLEGGKEVGVSTFTIEDAKVAQLAGGDNWRKYPKNMLFARAMTNGARWWCAEVFGGAVYTADELQAADPAGYHGGTGLVVDNAQFFEPERIEEEEAPPARPRIAKATAAAINDLIHILTVGTEGDEDRNHVKAVALRAAGVERTIRGWGDLYQDEAQQMLAHLEELQADHDAANGFAPKDPGIPTNADGPMEPARVAEVLAQVVANDPDAQPPAKLTNQEADAAGAEFRSEQAAKAGKSKEKK